MDNNTNNINQSGNSNIPPQPQMQPQMQQPQMPPQMPPQMYPQMPPQMPPQMYPQMPPQMQPQMPPQMPPQMAAPNGPAICATEFLPYQPSPQEIKRRQRYAEIRESAKSGKNLMLVFLCWIFGLMFTETVLFKRPGLFMPIMVLAFYGLMLFCLHNMKGEKNLFAKLLTIPVLLISAGYFLVDNTITYFIITATLFFLISVQFVKLAGITREGLFSSKIIPDAASTVFVNTFSFADTPFIALKGHGTGKDGKLTTGAKVLIGLLIALPVALIFLLLFTSADSVFSYFLNNIIEKSGINLNSVFMDLFFGTIIAIFVASFFISLRASKEREPIEYKERKGLDSTIVFVFLTVIAVIQLLFVIVQFGYLFSSGGMLPNGRSYANYARGGFFELCWVIGISAVIISLVIIFTQKTDNKQIPRGVAIALTSIILCNFVVFASAIFRMLKYIQQYDLTVKRIAVTWLIALMAVCFLGALFKVWMPRFKAFRYVCLCTIAMVMVLSFFNISTFAAEYNVNRYIESKYTRELDIYYLSTLGPSASHATARLLNENIDQNKLNEVQNALYVQKRQADAKSWRNFTLSDIAAGKIYKDNDITEYNAPTYSENGYNQYGYNRYGRTESSYQ